MEREERKKSRTGKRRSCCNRLFLLPFFAILKRPIEREGHSSSLHLAADLMIHAGAHECFKFRRGKKEMAGISLRMMVIALTRGVERKKLFPLFYVCYIPLGNSQRRRKKNSLGIPMMKLGSILCSTRQSKKRKG